MAMDHDVSARLDKGVRSLEKELSRKGMFENAGRKQSREFADWLDKRQDMSYGEKCEARTAFDTAAELAQDRFIAARNRKG